MDGSRSCNKTHLVPLVLFADAIGCLCLSGVVHAEGLPSQQSEYMLVGTIVCATAEGFRVPTGEESRFVVAVTPKRVLGGWVYSQALDSGRKREHQVFMYATDAILWPITVEFTSQKAAHILDSTERRIDSVVKQPAAAGETFSERLSYIQGGGFEYVPFALFFESASRNVRVSDVASLLSSGGVPARLANAQGTLTVTQQRGLSRIDFVQHADDCISSYTPSRKLRDLKFGPFSSGLQTINHSCRFIPAITPGHTSRWRAECITEYTGMAGETSRLVYTVSVEDCITYGPRIEQEIDKIVSLIPEGQPIITDDQMSYCWHDGTIVRTEDYEALARAEGLSFRSRRTFGQMFVIVSLLIGLTVLVYFRRRQVRAR